MRVETPITGPEVRRVNQLPLLIAALLIGFLVMLAGWRLLSKEQPLAPSSGEPGAVSVEDSRDGGKPALLDLAEKRLEVLNPEPTPPAAPAPVPTTGGEELFLDRQKVERLQEAAEQRQQMEASKLELLLSALVAPTAAGIATAQPAAGTIAPYPEAADASALGPQVPALANAATQVSPAQPAGGILRAGSIIPAILLTGIDSELPVQVVAQVGVPVYDTATGNQVLIPAGSRLIGEYANGSVLGQERLAVSWQLLQRPTGEPIPLGAMPGVDGAGYAGFSDRVEERYWRSFVNATLLGLISAGFQQSAADTQKLDTSGDERAAAAIGEQWNELGEEMVRSQMALGPRIRIRPGYRFNVMVTRDLVFAGGDADVG